MKCLKWNLYNIYFNEKKSDSIEIFQIVHRINTDGWQKVYQYNGKKVISNLCSRNVRLFFSEKTSLEDQHGQISLLILLTQLRCSSKSTESDSKKDPLYSCFLCSTACKTCFISLFFACLEQILCSTIWIYKYISLFRNKRFMLDEMT